MAPAPQGSRPRGLLPLVVSLALLLAAVGLCSWAYLDRLDEGAPVGAREQSAAPRADAAADEQQLDDERPAVVAGDAEDEQGEQEEEAAPALAAPQARAAGVEDLDLPAGWADHGAGDVDKCAITDALVEYTAARISGAKLVKKPYPHVSIDAVFEPKFYKECILPKMPDDRTVRNAFAKKSGSERYSLYITSEKSRASKIASQHNGTTLDGLFWDAFADAFAGPKVGSAWASLFSPVLNKRVGAQNTADPGYFSTSLELSRDFDSYDIPPHTDGPTKFVTHLYYVPKQEIPGAGTLVVTSGSGEEQRGFSASWVQMNNKKYKFKIAEQAKFAPNTAFAFAPCFSSWHAVNKFKKPPNGVRRETIQGVLRLAQKQRIAKKSC